MTQDLRAKAPFVLVVDDERMIADTLALILNRNGFEAQPVYSGEALLKAIEMRTPDAVISDVVMEGISGIEAAIRVSEALPDCKIILVSGEAVTTDLLAEARVDGYTFELLCKPVHPDEIFGRLNTLVDESGEIAI